MKALIERRISDASICYLTFDRPESSANLLDPPAFHKLNRELDFIESEPSLKGLVIASAKPKIFIAGLDLNSLSSELSGEAVGSLIETGQRTFTRLSRLPLTTVSAIHGACLGGGFELALACDYRIASSHSATKLGLPEVQLGLLPAWGGCTRLPHLIGQRKALKAILGGEIYSATKAKRLGIVDDAVYAECLLEVASSIASGPKRPRVVPFFAGSVFASSIIRSISQRRILEKSHGNYPAPMKALEVVTQALRSNVEDSLKREKQALLQLIETETCRNLVNVFFLQERSKKLLSAPNPRQSSAIRTQSVKQVAMVGAGLMGAGIAQWCSSRKLHVLLRDVDRGKLALGLASARRLYSAGIRRGIFTPREAQSGMDRIWPVEGEDSMRRAGLTIEAVFESLDLKRQLFRDLERRVGSETILASNTSALSITEIASNLKQPERFVGIHFFNPVHRMKLVEVVRGSLTSEKTLEAALNFVKRIGKLPVIVKDSPGFIVNRILMPYLLESVQLLREGHGIGRLDELAVRFGMPMGPLRLIDEVGLEVAQKVALYLGEQLSYDLKTTDDLDVMITYGWTGKGAGKGFYRYDRKGKTLEENHEIYSVLNVKEQGHTDPNIIIDRMLLLTVNEAARCLEEEVAEAPEDIDFAMIMGAGWAPFRGGPLRYADSIGIPTVIEKLEGFVEQAGDLFQPSPLLVDMARQGRDFYSAHMRSATQPVAPEIQKVS